MSPQYSLYLIIQLVDPRGLVSENHPLEESSLSHCCVHLGWRVSQCSSLPPALSARSVRLEFHMFTYLNNTINHEVQ